MLSPLDFVLLHLGSPGRYQLFTAFLIYCLQLPINFSNILWKYYTEEPPHRCRILEQNLTTTTISDWIPATFTTIAGSNTPLKSTMYLDPSNHWKGTQKCVDGWEYKPLDNEHNIVPEWDLVCENSFMIETTFYSAATMAIIGALFFGLVADHFERKRSLLMSLYLFLTAAFSLHLVQDYISFSLCYCLQSAFIAGVHVTSYVLLLELFPTPYQLQASLYLASFTIISGMLLPLIFWLIKSWRYVQLAVSAPGIVFLANVWLLPQSPLWLTLEGKMNSAFNLIEGMAAQNGKTSFPPSFRLHLQNLFNSFKNSGAFHDRHQLMNKFSSPCLRWYLLVHFYLFFVLGLSTEVAESHVLRLNRSKYADQFYSSLIDLGFLMFFYFFATRIGPRTTQSTLFVVSGLLLMASITIQELLPQVNEGIPPNDVDYRVYLLPSLLVLGCKSMLRTLPPFIWYHSVKTLPTGIRATGFAICHVWTILGHTVAPNLLILTNLIAPFIPIGLCGSLLVVGGGLSLLFPSCWRRPLPNTLEEAENKVFLVPKERYPSYSDLKGHSPTSGKPFESLSRRETASNVYTIPSTHPKYKSNSNGMTDLYYPPSVGGVDFYPLDSDSTDCESVAGVDANQGSRSKLKVGGSNWKLYSPPCEDPANCENGAIGHTNDSKGHRDMHVFSPSSMKAKNRVPMYAYSADIFVAETNL